MPVTRIATCRVCGATWGHDAPGRLPVLCPKHKGPGNKARDARAAASRGELEKARTIRGGDADNGLADPVVSEALRPAMLAAALSLTTNARQAARIAGLGDLDAKELRVLEKEARRDFGPLIEGSASAISAVGFATLSLALLRSIEGLNRISPSQRASSARSVVDVLERLSTAAKPSFGAMEISFKEDES